MTDETQQVSHTPEVQQIRRALANGAGWAWCDEHQMYRRRKPSCAHLHGGSNYE